MTKLFVNKGEITFFAADRSKFVRNIKDRNLFFHLEKDENIRINLKQVAKLSGCSVEFLKGFIQGSQKTFKKR